MINTAAEKCFTLIRTNIHVSLIMNMICNISRSHIACENCREVYRFTMSDVKVAVHRLKPHKSDGGAAGLSSDFIINAGDDCFVHTVNFLLVMIELFFR